MVDGRTLAGRLEMNPCVEPFIRQLHSMETSDVQAVAIAVFWYWVYRINGKIKR